MPHDDRKIVTAFSHDLVDGDKKKGMKRHVRNEHHR